jgi:hypothetical protein
MRLNKIKQITLEKKLKMKKKGKGKKKSPSSARKEGMTCE